MLVLVTLMLGCDRPEAPPATTDGGSAPPSAEPAAADGLVQGTPAGGPGQWIEEIRAGLDTLPELARREPAAAKNQALLLYVTRQEYLEIYYGTTGRAVKDTALAEAVMTAEARFHELLRTVNTPDGSIAVPSLAAAAAALSEQYERVLARARALGLDLSQVQVAGGAG